MNLLSLSGIANVTCRFCFGVGAGDDAGEVAWELVSEPVGLGIHSPSFRSTFRACLLMFLLWYLENFLHPRYRAYDMMLRMMMAGMSDPAPVMERK